MSFSRGHRGPIRPHARFPIRGQNGRHLGRLVENVAQRTEQRQHHVVEQQSYGDPTETDRSSTTRILNFKSIHLPEATVATAGYGSLRSSLGRTM